MRIIGNPSHVILLITFAVNRVSREQRLHLFFKPKQVGERQATSQRSRRAPLRADGSCGRRDGESGEPLPANHANQVQGSIFFNRGEIAPSDHQDFFLVCTSRSHASFG